MPAIEDRPTTRPPSPMAPLSTRPCGKSLRGKQIDGHHRVPPGVVHVREQLVAGDAGVVDQDVGLAAVVLGAGVR